MKLGRLIRHRLYDERDAERAIGNDAMARLRQRVADSERQHSGEIRICIEAGLPLSYLWRDADANERAVALFGKLRVWDTEHNNGVLIAEHGIEILADRGLNARVPPQTWRALTDGMSGAFKAGRFEEGLARAIDAVDALLREHFPVDPAERNTNELPDTPVRL